MSNNTPPVGRPAPGGNPPPRSGHPAPGGGPPPPGGTTPPLPGTTPQPLPEAPSQAPPQASPQAPPGQAPPGAGRPEPAPSGVDLARAALHAAKEQARARGALVQQKKQARSGGLRSGARADRRDPVPLASAISRLISEQAWEAPAAVGGVMGRWPQIVGENVAQHCQPVGYDDDPEQRVLTVQCDSTAWATQLRLLAPQLLARLNHDLGQGTVKRIKVQGPHAPVRRFGPLRAPGSRGPRDTYG